MKHELALILDFGSQYTQLIAKRTRHLMVYSEIVPYNIAYEEIIAKEPKAIILSGSPFSVLSENAPLCDNRIFDLNIPILGICYGMQLMSKLFEGEVENCAKKEYGYAKIRILDNTDIFYNLEPEEEVWMSHGDAVARIPSAFEVLASTDNAPNAAMKHREKDFYALQFHPEVTNSVHGVTMLSNFLFKISGFSADWTAKSFIETTIEDIKRQVGDHKVILGLSGGVDSSVTAALLYKAIGDNLIPIFVDTGLLRKDERQEVEDAFFGAFGLKLNTVKAGEEFLNKLRGVEEPETKRKIIGKTFIDIFETEAKKYADVCFLAQGTLYPDVIESVSFKGPSATIKSHHNVGGLPEKMRLELVEPLRELFKDEAREVGRSLGLPDYLIDRHPFPGPGLAIRILGEVTAEKAAVLSEADAIYTQELKKSGLYNHIWQAFAVLLGVKSVGVMGDERTYETVCALRAVTSNDGMTADVFEMPWEFLKRVSNRIINEVRGINRVVYDVSSKPPATIEWE